MDIKLCVIHDPSDGDNNLTNIHQPVLSVELPTRNVIDLSLKFGVRMM